MKRITVWRDVIGTTIVFVGLLILTVLIIFGENYLEQFKAH